MALDSPQPLPPAALPQQMASAGGRWVSFRPVRGDDAPVLFKWHSDLRHLHLWNADRRLFAFENFNAGYRNFVSGAIVVIIEDRENRPVGFARAYDLNFADGWLRLTLFVDDLGHARLQALEASALFTDYLFKSFAIRKIYSDVPEYDGDKVTVLERVGFVIEGRDNEHIWYSERYWDMLHMALFRPAWDRTREELLRLANLQEDLNAALGEAGEYEARIVV